MDVQGSAVHTRRYRVKRRLAKNDLGWNVSKWIRLELLTGRTLESAGRSRSRPYTSKAGKFLCRDLPAPHAHSTVILSG
jgi:hypothetical protein